MLLLGPGEWLPGDIRWAMAFWTIVGLAGLRLLAPTALRTAGPALLLVTIPGAIALATNAWTEPLLFAAFGWWAALMRRGHPNAAMVPLALACATNSTPRSSCSSSPCGRASDCAEASRPAPAPWR